jgi:hypothetical protein
MAEPSRSGPALRHRAIAELVGSAFLVAAVVGSGIAAQRLSPIMSGLQPVLRCRADCGVRQSNQML